MNNNKGNALNTLHTFYARYNGTRDNGFGTRVKNSGFSAVLSKNWWWRGRASGGGARLAWLAMQDDKARLV